MDLKQKLQKMKIYKKSMSILLLIFGLNLSAQRNEVKIIPVKVTDSIYMLKGSGGNIGVFMGNDGVFMIDDQFAPLTPKILKVIDSLANDKVKYLINTHWHGDHTGGNENMAIEGAVILSHENVRKRMNMEQVIRGKKREASPEEALPVITFTEDISVHFNDENVLVSHVHNAHTDGDAIVFFMNNNVIHMGDTYFAGKYPYIDLNSGGSINGYIEAAEKVSFLANYQTKIIPGHGDLSDKEELLKFKYMLITIKDNVQKEIDEGKTLEEVKKNTKITVDFDDEFGGGFISAERFRETVYKSLTSE